MRAGRLVRRRPEISVVVLDGSGPPGLTPPPRAVEVRRDTLAGGLADVRGRWVIVLDGDERVDAAFLTAMVRAADRRTAVVPADTALWSDDPTARMTAAVVTVGTAFPLAAARAAAAQSSAGEAATTHRLRALAALNRVPIGAATPEPGAAAGGPVSRALHLLAATAQWPTVVSPGQRFSRARDRARAELSRRAGCVVRGVDGARQEVLRALDEKTAGVDVRAFNAAAATDLAILYAAPPFLDTGGFVSARRLAARGEAYDAVVQDMGAHRPRDERSTELTRRDLGREMLTRGPVSAGAWPGIAQYCRDGMAQIVAAQAEKGAYRSVYSRSMWVAPTVLAAWYKVRHPEVPWTAELSDPLSLRTNGLRRPDPLPDDPIIAEITAAISERGLPGPPSGLFFDAAEWMVYSLADHIVFTNENQRELMFGAFPDQTIIPAARERSRIEHHPVPEAHLYEIGEPYPGLPAGKTTIGYFGTFYDVRGADDFVDPLAGLDSTERDRIALLIFTPNHEDLRAQLADHPARDAVTVLPALGYFDFLATTRALDWLVVADTHRAETFTVSPYLPSKYADYRGSGTPIWGIIDEGSVLSRQALDATSPLGDIAAATEVLRRISAGVPVPIRAAQRD